MDFTSFQIDLIEDQANVSSRKQLILHQVMKLWLQGNDIE